MKECVVVLGMHRSGTSVLTGLVTLFGGYIGSNLMPATEENSKGYYENNLIYELNEKILKEHNSSWKTNTFTVEEIEPDQMHRYISDAKKIIKNDLKFVNKIIIKDPRISILFPIWEKALIELQIKIKTIFTYRSPLEVSHSLQKRDGIVVEKGLLIWAHYFFQAELYQRKYKSLIVEYNLDFKDIDLLIAKLSEFLGEPLSEDALLSAKSFYEPSLKHHRIPMEKISDDLPNIFIGVIKLLKSKSFRSKKKMDELRNDFYKSTNFFFYNEDYYQSIEEENSELKLSLINELKEIDSKNKELQQKDVLIRKETDTCLILKNEIQNNKDLYEKELKYKEATIENFNKIIKDNNKEISILKNNAKKLDNELKKSEEKLVFGDQIFRKSLLNNEIKKKLRKSLRGQNYFKFKKIISFRAKNREKQLLDEKSLIVESGLFSPFYYLTQNIDVWHAGLEPLNHFCKHGWKEGRNPSQYFDCKAYLNANNDVKKSGKNPLIHYIKYGQSEGRSPEVVQTLITTEKERIKVENKITKASCKAIRDYAIKRVLPEIVQKETDFLVSIIILNRDGLEHLKVLVPALYENTKGINYELIVVDNASKDKSVEYLENCEKDLSIKIIKNSVNETFSVANNKASKMAKGKYIVLLNNDIEPLFGWLHFMLKTYDIKDNIGSVGSRLVYPFKESFEHSCNVQHAGIAFRDETGFFRPYNVCNGNLIQSEKVKQSGSKCAVTAASLLVKKEIYHEVGGLDEGYNYGYEDVDFGLKLVEAGYINYYCSDSILFHHEFGTQNKNKRDEIRLRRIKNASYLRIKWSYFIKQNYWKEKIFNQSKVFSDKPLKVAITVTDYGPKVAAGDFFTAQELANELEKLGWDVVYLSRAKNEWYEVDEEIDVLINLIDAFDLSKIPHRNKRLIKIAWARNWFDRWCDNKYFKEYDFIFASSHIACNYIEKHSQQNALIFPIASNPDRFSIKTDVPDHEQYESDICFTGNYWSSPRDIMEALSDEVLKKYEIHIYGANWEKFDRFKPFHKGFIEYDKIPNVYHNTKIVIDDAVNDITKPYGSVNSRVFDALMAGALVITNGVEGSIDLFSGELPYYEDSEDLDKLLNFYLNDDRARKSKVSQLKGMILKEHTYRHRAVTIRDTFVKRFLSKSIAIKVPAPNWEGVHSWGDYHMAVLLKQQLVKQGYHVLIQILPEWDNDEGMEYDAVIVLRGLSRYKIKPHQLNLMWNISHPDKVTLEEYEEYDKVFIASEMWAKKISNEVSVPVETMLQCTDPERFREPQDSEVKAYKKQLLFVGNSRDVYRKILKDLIPTDFQLAVYGKNWDKIIPTNYIKGTHIQNDELYRYYGSSDILLNDHWDDMREKGFVSNRIFDGLACGAFIISDKVSNMGELEEFLQTYENKKELKKFIKYYLEHDSERMKKSSRGKDFVAKHHTFEARARQFSTEIDNLMTFQEKCKK